VDDVPELAAHLQTLLTDEPLRKRLAAAASEGILTQFTFAKAASAMQQIYESVLNAKRRKTHYPAIGVG